MHPLLTTGFIAIMLSAAAAPAPAATRPPESVAYYDMTPLFSLNLNDPVQRRRFWDETHLVVSLQGLANRTAPRLYLRYVKAPDDFWWKAMTGPGAWLSKRRVEKITSLDALLRRFRGYYRGAVAWDERVSATSNLASTIAGCDSLLCLRYDASPGSLYHHVTSDLHLPVTISLRATDGGPLFTGKGSIPGTALASTGSAKADAYRWLIEHYVRTGKSDPHRTGYYLDGFWLNCWNAAAPVNHTLTNQDYVIAHRGVLFDLDPWNDEAPVDDPGQKPGTDAATLQALLRAGYERFHGDGMIHVAGFVPWAYKYTDARLGGWDAGGHHGGVPTEWRYAEILSSYNAFMDADALGLGAMANASFFQHYPLKKHYPQNPKPNRASLIARGILDKQGKIIPRRYVAHYVGDYDSAAWLYQELPRMWNDPARGATPLSWAFNPNLADRFAFGMAWARERRTPNDYFVAGDSGAGYLNPGNLTPPREFSGLPSGLAAWEKHCQQFFRQWDLSLTGFVIDGYAPGLSPAGLDAYARFSPNGFVAQKIPQQGVHGAMPYIRMGGDLPGNPGDAAQTILNQSGASAPHFLVVRSILKQPSWYQEVDQELKRRAGDGVRVVDLYTLLWLVREYETHRSLYVDRRYSNVKQVQALPEHPEGLTAIYNADGPFQLTRRGDVSCWLLPGHQPPYYLYFAVSRGFYHPGSGPVEIEIEYLDAGHGTLQLMYDSTDKAAGLEGAYKAHPEVVERHGSGEWRQANFRIEDARFEGRQNGEADFRFYSEGDDLLVREVRVRRVGAAP